ncbi:MAG: proline iminopeptidase-family hydrolase [Pseudomonadales bacterium]|nr:proline iminopeptidase-family hydrolase [Pseudomonadales bacterium]
MIPRSLRLVVLAVLVLLGSCRSTGLEPREGFVDVPGGRVWYRIVGGGTGIPLLLLHGGPGAPSYYLNPLAALADERPVIFYDQLGAGRSDKPTDGTLWRVERFVEELRRLRTELRLDEVHILGHSWGAMLAVDYMLTKPAGVRSLILASPGLSIRRFLDDAQVLKKMLPESVQTVIAEQENAGTFDSPEYQSAVTEYYRRFLCRRDPWPDDVNQTFAEFGESVYRSMWGPSEFTATGTLRNYDRTAQLKELRLPVLLTSGKFDEVTPATAEYYQSLIPGAKLRIFENSAHLTMQDEPEAYVQAVRDFLHDVESR